MNSSMAMSVTTAKIAVAVFMTGFMQSILLVNLLLMLSNLPPSNTESAPYFLTAFYGISFLLSLLTSYLADRMGNSSLLIILLCMVITFFCWIFLLSPSPEYKLVSLIIGMPPSFSILTQLFTLSGGYLEKRQTIIVRGTYSVAFVVGPPVGTTLALQFGYDSILMLLSACAVAIIFIVTSIKLPETSSASEIRKQDTSDRKLIGLDVILAFLALVLLHGSMSLTTSFLPLLVTDTIGANSSVTGLALGLGAFVEIIVIMQLSRLDMFRSNTVMLFGCLLGLLYFLLLINADNSQTVVLSQILNGSFVAIMVGIGLVWMQNIHGGGLSLKTALFVNSYSVGAIMLTPVTGFIANSQNDLQMGLGSGIVFILGGATLLVVVSIRQMSNPSVLLRNPFDLILQILGLKKR